MVLFLTTLTFLLAAVSVSASTKRAPATGRSKKVQEFVRNGAEKLGIAHQLSGEQPIKALSRVPMPPVMDARMTGVIAEAHEAVEQKEAAEGAVTEPPPRKRVVTRARGKTASKGQFVLPEDRTVPVLLSTGPQASASTQLKKNLKNISGT